MRVILDVFREADGRLEGRVQRPDGTADDFASTLDLLRVLEGIDLSRSPRDPDRPAPERPGRHTVKENRG